eukprot:gene15359-21444_t
MRQRSPEDEITEPERSPYDQNRLWEVGTSSLFVARSTKWPPGSIYDLHGAWKLGSLEGLEARHVLSLNTTRLPEVRSIAAPQIVFLASVLFNWNPSWDDLVSDADAIDVGVNVSAEGKSLPYPLQDMRPVPLDISRSSWESEVSGIPSAVSDIPSTVSDIPNTISDIPSTVSDITSTLSDITSTVFGTPITVPGVTSTASGNTIPVSGNNTEQPIPPGWDLIYTVIIPETEDGSEDGFDDPGNVFLIPIASAITQGNMMVILVRGTLTKYEWMINFDYAFTNFEKVDPRLEGMGRTHAGFSKLALQVFDDLQPILEEQVVKGPINHVSISG